MTAARSAFRPARSLFWYLQWPGKERTRRYPLPRRVSGRLRRRTRRQTAALQNLQDLSRSLNKQAKAQGLTPEGLEEMVEETNREIFEELYG
jgi:predicted transposase YdaD